ncbi:MAG: cell division protein FtsZ, partial [Rubrivivax sp.]|nr:cell division protein FtsZ [Rubrivivax sp.]
MTLTLGLVVFGALLLLALALHGWWSTRRAQPRKATESPAAAE